MYLDHTLNPELACLALASRVVPSSPDRVKKPKAPTEDCQCFPKGTMISTLGGARGPSAATVQATHSDCGR